VVSKNLGFSGVDKAEADDRGRGPPDVTILKLWVLVTEGRIRDPCFEIWE
jgi:hypothetical protein